MDRIETKKLLEKILGRVVETIGYCRYDLIGANLAGANLSGAYLCGAT